MSEKARQTIIDYTVKGLGIGIVGLYNIQFIVDRKDNVRHRGQPPPSRTVPFSAAPRACPGDIATRVMLGSACATGIVVAAPRRKSGMSRPRPSASPKLGMDAYLSPEMKSTGEAIGYKRLTRALYKAMQSSGMNVANYGTIFVTIADTDKDEALPLIRRFYDMGFNIEATRGTAEFSRPTASAPASAKLSEGSEEILDFRQGHVNYVINTREPANLGRDSDGAQIRRCAVENNVTMFTALDTVRVLLEVLEEITLCISTIDS